MARKALPSLAEAAGKTAWSESDSLDFLRAAYFGNSGDPVARCISRAYRDMNRTMRGFASTPLSRQAHEEAVRTLEQRVGKLRDDASLVGGQSDFDVWHHETCQRLIDAHTAHGWNHFYYGQAQKWLNMTLKYAFVLGKEQVTGFCRLFPYCHAPLDNVVLAALEREGFRGLSVPWSQLSYNEYLQCQYWMRTRFEDSPLDVEFRLWMGKPVKAKEISSA